MAPSAIMAELDRAARLRTYQLAFLVGVVVLVLVVTFVLTRSLNEARTVHRTNAEMSSALVDRTNEAHGIIEEYLRTSRATQVRVPPHLYLRMQTLGARVRVLVDREQRRDAGSPAAEAARNVQGRYDDAMRLAAEYLRNGGPGSERGLNSAFEGPVARYFAGLEAWTDAARARADHSLQEQNNRTRTLLTWLGVMMTVLVLGGLIVYWWFGQVRSRLTRGFTDIAAEQAALRRVATSVAESEEPHSVFQTIADEIVTLLGSDGGWLDECERDSAITRAQRVPDEWIPLAQGRDPRAYVDPGSVRGMALRSGAPARIADYRTTPGIISQEAISLGIRTAVAAPIIVEGRPWGVILAMDRDPAQLPEGCEQRLVPFARLAAVAAANARARTLLAERASTDALTLLPNHGAFQQALTEGAAEAHLTGTPLGLIILDIDHFKAVNDTYGHPVGDRVLTEIAARMNALVRSGELLARTGGEEFAWLLPGTDADGARAAAERAREAVRSHPVDEAGVITISAGVCTLDMAEDAHDLLAKADRSLLDAKTAGRDRTMVYGVDDRGPDAARPGRLEQARALEALHSLARAVDARHSATVDHSARVAETAVLVARDLGWERRHVELLRDAALLHDVGKVGRPTFPPDRDKTTSDAQLGAQLLGDVLTSQQTAWIAGHDRPHLSADAVDDRTTYEGEHILAATNFWDSLTHGDGTRPALSPAEAIDAMRAMRGTRLDARVVDALLANATITSPRGPRT